MFIGKMHGLFLRMTKKVLQLPFFKNFWMNLIAKETKCGWIKAVNFTIDQ